MHEKPKQLTYLVLLIWLCGVAGCAMPPPKVEVAEQKLDAQLDQSIQKINQLLIDMTQRDAQLFENTQAPDELDDSGLIAVKWQGDAPDVLRHLARLRKLRFAIKGRAIPLPIFVQAEHARFVDVLEDIGVQLGERADVVLKKDALEIHYRGF